jgi:hypothetical protein
MNVRAMPRTAVESYLRLIRLPVDAAIRLLSGNGAGANSSVLPGNGPGANSSANPPDEALRSGPRIETPTPTLSANPKAARQNGAQGINRHSSDEFEAGFLHGKAGSGSHEEIAARAYELYERGVPGTAEAHWLAAEREVMSLE